MVSRFSGPQGLDPFQTLQREVGRVFDDVMRGFGGDKSGGFNPRLDVHDTDGALEVTAELPGLSHDDIDLRVEGDVLTLCGEKKDERAAQRAGVQFTERSFGRFQRSFRLPFRPDPTQVRACFDRGVLHITLPRPAEHQGMGRIPISAAEREGQGAPPASPPPAGGTQNAPPQRGQPDEVDEAGRESFPASDPPAWSGGTTGPSGASGPG